MIEWFNENELRSYPLREGALQRSDTDETLPTSILADMCVVVDLDIASQVYVSSVGVSPSFVSISVAGPSGALLVATVENPIPHIPYRLDPLATGVSGFVVFGVGINVNAPSIYRFSGVADSGLEDKAIRPFETPPVRSIGKEGVVDPPLVGDVRFEVGTDMYLRRVDNTIYIGLKAAARPLFVGPCDRTIDYITCGRPPLRTINGVGPDVNGVITIEVQ